MNPLSNTLLEGQRVKQAMNKEKNSTCKNGKFILAAKEVDVVKLQYDFSYQNTGCTNPRRNGSAWCQDCSDKFKNNEVFLPV